MIHPTCLEVLATVQSAFTREIVPKLDDMEARSAAATIEHLLRHIGLRIELEGGLLTTDIQRLVTLLEKIASWIGERDMDLATMLHDAVDQERQAAGSYRNLDQLGASSLALRTALVAAQGQLQERSASDGEAAALHEELRAYIGTQLADEAKLIEPAFTGRGPRR